jgi:hypothetical protein
MMRFAKALIFTLEKRGGAVAAERSPSPLRGLTKAPAGPSRAIYLR